jgi:hypothetical protein
MLEDMLLGRFAVAVGIVVAGTAGIGWGRVGGPAAAVPVGSHNYGRFLSIQILSNDHYMSLVVKKG